MWKLRFYYKGKYKLFYFYSIKKTQLPQVEGAIKLHLNYTIHLWNLTFSVLGPISWILRIYVW
jgi:hypothetical protein